MESETRAIQLLFATTSLKARARLMYQLSSIIKVNQYEHTSCHFNMISFGLIVEIIMPMANLNDSIPSGDHCPSALTSLLTVLIKL